MSGSGALTKETPGTRCDVCVVKHRRNTAAATITMLAGFVLTSLLLPTDLPANVFAIAGIGVGLTLALATGIEAKRDVRSLVRLDVVMLWVLYGLTFSEFLFPQPDVDALISVTAATSATNTVLLGFAALALGRHLVPRLGISRQVSGVADLRPAYVFWLFVLVTFVGYLHILFAVNFDIFEALREMSLPRFSQSWGRGQYGDLYALFYETGMLIYLIPPIAGLTYARSTEFGVGQKLFVTIVFLVTLYYGFASGTRNIAGTYVITFAATYLLCKPRVKLWRTLFQGALVTIALVLAMIYMLEFRTVGLGNFSFAESQVDTLRVDRNMIVISQIIEAFASGYDFLGLEIPINALIRPVPRVLWPGKPEGLSVSIESIAGAGPATTVACTFIGEAYMAGGLLGVILFGMLFGAAAEMWNRVARNTDSLFTQLLYVSGYLSGAIAMRSMLSVVPLMIPSFALWVYWRFRLGRSSQSQPAAVVSSKKT